MKLKQYDPELLERVFCVIERAAEFAAESPMIEEQQTAATTADENKAVEAAMDDCTFPSKHGCTLGMMTVPDARE